MKEEIKLANGIYDIVSPTEPALSTSGYVIIILLIAICSATIIYITFRLININRIRIKRKIRRLKTAHNNKTITTHAAVYQLCSLLCAGLKIQAINQNDALPENMTLLQPRWNSFADELSRLRYQKTGAQQDNVIHLFDESLFWLRKWP